MSQKFEIGDTLAIGFIKNKVVIKALRIGIMRMVITGQFRSNKIEEKVIMYHLKIG